jgi:hypothetical protein
MVLKDCHSDKRKIVVKTLILIAISLVIGIVQTVFCRTLFYGFLDIMQIPTKRDLAMGLGLWYWWHFQFVIAIVASLFLLVVKKRLWQIIILCCQMLLFALYWSLSLSIYPYRITFLFCVTLCGMLLGMFLIQCCKIYKEKNKTFH